MSLIVAKFGGTSVASPERIQMVAKKVIAKKQAGHDVVAVVSAMGKTTDELVGLARALNQDPPAREMDRLLSVIHISLSDFELRVLSLYLGGYKRQEAERKLGISARAFDNAMARVRKKLRQKNNDAKG